MSTTAGFGQHFAVQATWSSEDLDRFADLLAPRIAERLTPTPQAWLDTRGAAEYLGITRNALHKLTAARRIPFEQERPGAKCWFRAEDLDAWRRSA